MNSRIKGGDFITFIASTMLLPDHIGKNKWYGPITNWNTLHIELEVKSVAKQYKTYGVWYDTTPLLMYWERSNHNCAYVDSEVIIGIINQRKFPKQEMQTWAPLSAI